MRLSSIADSERLVTALTTLVVSFAKWTLSDHIERSLYPNDPVKACEIKKQDIALNTAMFWPHAELSRLVVCSYISLWLFLWDDQIDVKTGTRHSDMEAARRAHAEVLSYMSYCLQLDYGYPEVKPTDPLVLLFKEIGDALCREYDIGGCFGFPFGSSTRCERLHDKDQREDVFEYLRLYIQGIEKEQLLNVENRMPSIDEYLAIRRQSSAVLLTLVMNE